MASECSSLGVQAAAVALTFGPPHPNHLAHMDIPTADANAGPASGRAGDRRLAFVVQAIPLGAILVLAVELRLLFRTGMVHVDSLVYTHLARNLAHGIGWFTDGGTTRWAMVRTGLYGPVALFYAVFGANEVTTFLWPFACSLLGIVCAYGIGRKLAGEVAGLLAAFLWAILPTDIAAATALLGDGPIAALSMAAVFFLLVAESARGWRLVAALAASVVCLLVGIVNKSAILLLVVFLVAYVVGKRPKNRLLWFGLGAAVIAGVVGYGYLSLNTYYRWTDRPEHGWDAVVMRLRIVYWSIRDFQGATPTLKTLANSATDWWSHLVMGAPEFSWITPLWIVAAAALLALRRRQAYVPLLWFWSMFLWLTFGSRSIISYAPITTASMGPAMTRHFLLLAAPPTIATAIYLAQELRLATWRWLIPVVVVAVGAVAWAGARYATNLSWGVTGEAAAALPFSTVSAIAAALVMFGSFSSPLFATGRAAWWKSAAMAVLLLAIGLGSLNLSYRAANQYRLPWVTTFPEAVRYLDKAPPLPLLVQNDFYGLQLDYSSRFRFGFDLERRQKPPLGRITVAPQDPSKVGDAYVLIDDFIIAADDHDPFPRYWNDPPASWAEVARFGDRKGYQLRMYRVAGAATAAVALEAAERAVTAGENGQTLRQLLDAATNAGQFCRAAQTWTRLRVVDARSLREFNPIKMLGECYAASPDVGGPNLFVNGDFARGLDGWGRPPAPGVDVVVARDPRDGVAMAQVTTQSAGQRAVILQNAQVFPESAYVFEATLKSTAPIVALYWESDVARFHSEGAFPDWTTIRYVFVTPRWDGKARPVDFIPFLLKGPGQVWLKNAKLVPLRFESSK